MALYVNNKEIENVYFKDTKIERVFANGKMVYEATIYVDKPTVIGEYTYNTAAQAPTISGYDEAAMTISGTQSATEAGTYHVYFTLNKGYAWKDGTANILDFTWTIAKRSIAIPTLSATSFTWLEGDTHTVTVSGLDTTYVSQTGDLSQTDSSSNIGTSNVITWALKNTASCVWSDGTTGNKTASWKAAWVNGTSHYKTDLYNSGWNSGYIKSYKDASITPVQFNSDHIYTKAVAGGGSVYFQLQDTSDSLEEGKTLHIAFVATKITGQGSSAPTYAGYLAAQHWYMSGSDLHVGPQMSAAARATSSADLSYKYSGTTSGCKYGVGIAGWTEVKITRIWAT